ncbi:hypothetical protein A2970_02160 [Candidatus Roizmanbacteria bacterium RIFCSPLOWO2_01_FULL_44_13]|uniref:Uncharacterized protein n=1 Tax=Candidatus Roizmanbacteria bacterium RIFCSPLOWO2_01_FULL_44_13 TaxID=1802069 RepID=A0A1F7JB91_9BACT|nr:MAG: hypothetical protein A2970_02160 [Candidatus Roizmanbacteria bacterium RIFCSPLOWO2_01_FULL_44_13]
MSTGIWKINGLGQESYDFVNCLICLIGSTFSGERIIPAIKNKTTAAKINNKIFFINILLYLLFARCSNYLNLGEQEDYINNFLFEKY